MVLTLRPEINDSYVLCVIDRSLLIHQSPSLKRNSLCKIKLFSLENLNSSFNINISNMMPQIG